MDRQAKRERRTDGRRKRETDKERNGWTERVRDFWTDGQTENIQMNGWMNRQTERSVDR